MVVKQRCGTCSPWQPNLARLSAGSIYGDFAQNATRRGDPLELAPAIESLAVLLERFRPEAFLRFQEFARCGRCAAHPVEARSQSGISASRSGLRFLSRSFFHTDPKLP